MHVLPPQGLPRRIATRHGKRADTFLAAVLIFAAVPIAAILTWWLDGVRTLVDKGYAGHDVPKPLRVFRSGQTRGVFGIFKRELRRRSAIEAVIGHMKTNGRLGRNFFKGRHGDHVDVVLTAVGYNLRLILRWLRLLLHKTLQAILTTLSQPPLANPASSQSNIRSAVAALWRLIRQKLHNHL